MKIAIYSRKSKFTGIGDSIENQLAMCREFAKSKFKDQELEFDEYEDEGFTGSNLNRPKFKELMKKIRKYDVLICYRLDRISRNVADFSSTLEILQSCNCDFISIKEQFDTSNPMGRAMIYIASVFAQLERETIAERIRDNMLEMGKNGCWTGGRVPLGYESKKIKWIDENGNERSSANLTINEEESKIVEMIYDVYLKEGSLHKTEVWFTSHNIKSRQEILLEKTSLKLILQNPVYVKSTPEVADFLRNDGWNVYGKTDKIHGFLSYNKTESVNINGKVTKKIKDKSLWIAAISNVPGIIDSDIWLKVQFQLKKNKDSFPRKISKANNSILTGVLKCAKCGSSMVVTHGKVSKKTGEKLFYYVCSMKRRSRSTMCNSKNLRANDIEEVVLSEVEKFFLNRKELAKNLKEKFIKIQKDQSNVLKKKSIQKQIKEKNKQIGCLVNKLSIDNDITDILVSKIKELKKEINICEDEIKKIDDESLSNNELISVDSIEKTLNKYESIYNLSREEQRKLINILIDSVYYNSDTNEVVINFFGR